MKRDSRRVEVLSLGWLGVRSTNAPAMADFYRDVLCLHVLREDATESRFRTKDDTEVHVYGMNDQNHPFFGTGPVVGFAVNSFALARAALLDAGVEFLYPNPQRQDGRAWQHFRAPDGNVYEIIGPDDLDLTP